MTCNGGCSFRACLAKPIVLPSSLWHVRNERAPFTRPPSRNERPPLRPPYTKNAGFFLAIGIAERLISKIKRIGVGSKICHVLAELRTRIVSVAFPCQEWERAGPPGLSVLFLRNGNCLRAAFMCSLAASCPGVNLFGRLVRPNFALLSIFCLRVPGEISLLAE